MWRRRGERRAHLLAGLPGAAPWQAHALPTPSPNAPPPSAVSDGLAAAELDPPGFGAKGLARAAKAEMLRGRFAEAESLYRWERRRGRGGAP